MLDVLVACEESQRVCQEFRKLGHNAYSCDLLECSGGHPEWHIQQDVIKILNGYCWFKTQDGKTHIIDKKWDLIVAHPPCTDLAVSGARHFEVKRKDGRQEKAIKFFCKFLNCDCDHVMIENPVGIISGDYILEHFKELANKEGLPLKPNQIIHPYYFGDPYKKKTCLWLKNLPLIEPTNIVEPEKDFICSNGKHYPQWMMDSLTNCKTNEERSIVRSKTFEGFAKAIASQFSNFLED